MHGTPLTTQTHWPNSTAEVGWRASASRPSRALCSLLSAQPLLSPPRAGATFPPQDWRQCQATLYDVCPSWRGAGMECMQCVEQYRPQVPAARMQQQASRTPRQAPLSALTLSAQSPAQVEKVCGNFSFHDSADQGFNVHFFCGIGWPESVIANSTIAEYCVADTPMPAALAKKPSQDGAPSGWAQYVSCNSDETDYFGNKPRDPLCVCWVRVETRAFPERGGGGGGENARRRWREPAPCARLLGLGPPGATFLLLRFLTCRSPTWPGLR